MMDDKMDWILKSRNGKLHVADENNKPLCGTSGRVREIDASSIPDDYYEKCRDCEKLVSQSSSSKKGLLDKLKRVLI